MDKFHKQKSWKNAEEVILNIAQNCGWKSHLFSLFNRISPWWDLERDVTFHNWNPTWNGFHPATGNKLEKISLNMPNFPRLGSTYTKQKCWNASNLLACHHTWTKPSNAKLVLNAKWKCDVRLRGCRKTGTKPKSLRNGKSSMQWVGIKTGCSENISKWLARDYAGSKAESSVAVVLNSLSTWTLFTDKAWSYPDYQDQKERELS